MIDLHLRAVDEAALAAALPMLRALDEGGGEAWITGSAGHVLDPGIPIVSVPVVLAEDGSVTTPAVLRDGFHANLRLDPCHPAAASLFAAAAPFVVEPDQPQRIFA